LRGQLDTLSRHLCLVPFVDGVLGDFEHTQRGYLVLEVAGDVDGAVAGHFDLQSHYWPFASKLGFFQLTLVPFAERFFTG
jgi:hypothetical protein